MKGYAAHRLSSARSAPVLHATTVVLDGRTQLRLLLPDGTAVGDYPSPEAIVAAGIDLTRIEHDNPKEKPRDDH